MSPTTKVTRAGIARLAWSVETRTPPVTALPPPPPSISFTSSRATAKESFVPARSRPASDRAARRQASRERSSRSSRGVRYDENIAASTSAHSTGVSCAVDSAVTSARSERASKRSAPAPSASATPAASGRSRLPSCS